MTHAVAIFEDASVAFGRSVVWSGASFALPQASCTALVGANGSGKTTLLRVLLGQVPLAAGRVEVINGAPGRGNAAIGYVPQRRTLAADLAVRGYDLVLLGLTGHRWGFGPASAVERQIVMEALESVCATDFAQRPVGTLSGGQQQRLLIAQALVTRPQLLLLDEPLTSLDQRTQHDIVNVLDALRHERHMAILLVTHDERPVRHIVDSVICIENGRVTCC